MNNFWKKWLKISKKIVNVEANILLTILYFLLIVPLAFILQTMFRNVLEKDSSDAKKTYWRKRTKTKYDLEWAKQQ